MAEKSTTMNIRMDTELKKQAELLFSKLGMSMTTAFNVFMRQAVREQRIPFELKLDVPNAETIAAMEEVQQMKRNHGLGKTYTNADQMMAELLNDDV